MKVETIFEFIKFTVSGQAGEFAAHQDLNWEELYDFAKKQTIIGVLFAGIEKLPKAQQPEKKLLMKWYMQTERIRSNNKERNADSVTVFNRFKKDGFQSTILKGQGVALLYPDPLVRTCGDIDIWVDADRQRIFDYVNGICPGRKQRMIHVDFPILKGTEVEVHYTPSYMYAPWNDRKLQSWFRQNAAEQFRHIVELPGDVGQVCVPTLSFNRIFILSHIYKHLFSEGVGLRQLMDYYYVLKCGFTVEENQHDRAVLKHLDMLTFAGAVVYVLQVVFGLEDEYCIVEPDRKAGEFFLSEIIQSGNFGHYDERYGMTANESVAHRYFRITRRNLHFVSSYPSEALSEPVRRTWLFFWRLFN